MKNIKNTIQIIITLLLSHGSLMATDCTSIKNKLNITPLNDNLLLNKNCYTLLIAWEIENNNDDTVFILNDYSKFKFIANGVEQSQRIYDWEQTRNGTPIKKKYYEIEKRVYKVIPPHTKYIYVLTDFQLYFDVNYEYTGAKNFIFNFFFKVYGCDEFFATVPIKCTVFEKDPVFEKENWDARKYLDDCRTCNAVDYFEQHPDSKAKESVLLDLLTPDEWLYSEAIKAYQDPVILSRLLNMTETNSFFQKCLVAELSNMSFYNATESTRQKYFKTLLNHPNISKDLRKDLKKCVMAKEKNLLLLEVSND